MTDPVRLTGPLAALPDDELARLVQQSTTRQLGRDDVLMRQGERGEHVAVVLEGRFRVVVTTRSGRSILVAVRGPGTVFGEFAAVDGGRRSATISALEPARVRTVANELLRDVVRRHPDVVWGMLLTAVRRLRVADMRFVGVATEVTRTRVARAILELAAQHGVPCEEGIRLDLPLSQEELAGLVAASRETVSASMSDLRRGGMISTHRMGVTICDVDGLREIALRA